MKHSITYLLIFSLVGLASCKKDKSGDTNPVPPVDKIAPDGFTFKTAKDVTVDVTLRSNNDQPLKGVIVSLYKADNMDADASIFKGVTDANGNLKATINVDSYLDKIVIDPSYVGLMRYATAAINGTSTKVVIGGAAGFSGDIIGTPVRTSSIRSNSLGTTGLVTTDYVYPDGYNATNAFTTPTNLGRPKYLEATSDVIDASLLSYVNASLPEGKPLTTTHPEYLTSTATTTINVKAKSDVWITYVSEGAGYQNALGFFTYKTATPPTAASGGTLLGGIDKITYIFPNASNSGSGGGLKSGDKVKLGTFEAGTSIGFVILQDAWNGSAVSTSGTKFYSIDKFNPETTSTLRKHNVMLYDDVHKLFLFGFEDINRQSGSDNDFNDLVVYATANPITAISTDNVATIDDGGDSDGDGVLDELDAFPNDASKAFVSYFPSENTYSQVAFEDNWPQKGDYDLNDLVVNYRYTFTSNAKNQVVTLKGDFNAVAAGASFKNGFGVQLPVSATTVASVTGQKIIGNIATFGANGVESGQTKAVIIPFDNQDAVIKNADNSFFINTQLNRAKVTGTAASVLVTFGSPIDQANLAASAFNPFLISNQRRGVEVHLPGYAPTDKADPKLFGTSDDGSKAAGGTYYTSTENWPWAISFNTAVNYPVEEANITKAYLHFADWAASGGTQYIDWYSNTTPGYRNDSFIYLK